MRIFVLYSLLLFPLCCVIAKNGYVEQNPAKYSSLIEQDTLYIETEETEFEILYRLCFDCISLNVPPISHSNVPGISK